jgi:hypothetical protein
MRGRLLALFAISLAVWAGCSHNIGDGCSNNVDCDPTGLRFCDTASPGGYCTIDGCDINTSGSDTCPGNSVCIRFFTPISDEPCLSTAKYPDNGCPSIEDRCVCDSSNKDGTCMSPPPDPTTMMSLPDGHCAPASSERRWCQARCSSDGDCRAGYQCRSTGTMGAQPLPLIDMGVGMPSTFCAPIG